MAYWFFDDAILYMMFPASLRDVTFIWFNRLSFGQINSFRELAKQFTAMFIINIRAIKGPAALTNLKNKKGETLLEYVSRYWKTYQETNECDFRFALNTFKYGLPKDTDDIYNSLTRVPPYTFNELLSRVNEFAKVKDDELDVMGPAEKKRRNNGKFD